MALDRHLGLEWQSHDGGATLSCPVTWHGERGLLMIEQSGPGPAMLSLVGTQGVLWTRPLPQPARTLHPARASAAQAR
jgi:hypothetical protein